jgi:hypothetical protein
VEVSVQHGPSFEPISTSVFKIASTTAIAFNEEIIWKDGYVHQKSDKPCFRVDIGVRTLEFCVLPEEVSDFDKIGDITQYKWRQLTIPKIKEDVKVSSHYTITSYVMLLQNHVMLLRELGNPDKCVAIRPLEFKPKYKTWEETPRMMQYGWADVTNKNGKHIPAPGQPRFTETDKKASPVCKSVVFEWKRIHPGDNKEPLTSLSYEITEGTASVQLSEAVKIEDGKNSYAVYPKFFRIPGVDNYADFSFSCTDPESWLDLDFHAAACFVEKAFIATTKKSIDDIDLSSLDCYSFREIKGEKSYDIVGGACLSTKNPERVILKLDDRCVVINTLKMENGQVAYKWKYGRIPVSETKLAAIQQVAFNDEANQKSGVKQFRILELKKFYFAGVDFSFEVPAGPKQDSATLHYEVKLKSLESIGIALAKESEIRDVNPATCKFRESYDRHGSGALKLMGQPVVFKIGSRFMAIRPTSIENSDVGNAVVYELKDWPDAIPPAR